MRVRVRVRSLWKSAGLLFYLSISFWGRPSVGKRCEGDPPQWHIIYCLLLSVVSAISRGMHWRRYIDGALQALRCISIGGQNRVSVVWPRMLQLLSSEYAYANVVTQHLVKKKNVLFCLRRSRLTSQGRPLLYARKRSHACALHSRDWLASLARIFGYRLKPRYSALAIYKLWSVPQNFQLAPNLLSHRIPLLWTSLFYFRAPIPL